MVKIIRQAMEIDKPIQNDETVSVLLVGLTDHTDQCLLDALVKAGYQCCVVPSFRQVTDLLQNDDQPQVLILSQESATLDDLAWLQQKTNKLLSPVVIGDHVDRNLLEQYRTFGIHHFITRPANLNLLLMAVDSAQHLFKLQQRETSQHQLIQSYQLQDDLEQEVASTIYNNVLQNQYLQTDVVKSMMSATALFNGDLLLVDRTPDNHLHILLGDFTGYGLSASVFATPVASIFYGMTRKGFALLDIVKEINSKLHKILPVSQFLAATAAGLYPNQKSLQLISCGLPDHILINQLDGSHQLICSKNIPLGIQSSVAWEEKSYIVGAHHRLYMLSDGLLEAENSNGEAFGLERAVAAVCDSAGKGFDTLQNYLASHLSGIAQKDDISFVELTCDVDNVPWQSSDNEQSQQPIKAMNWKTMMELDINALRALNPVPVIVNALMEIQGLQEHRQAIFLIITELFANALDHGVLDLDSNIKSSPEGFMRFYELKEERLQQQQQGFIRLMFSHASTEQGGRLTIKVTDSGNGFDWRSRQQNLAENQAFSGRGLNLIRTLCSSLFFHGKGNRITATYDWQ